MINLLFVCGQLFPNSDLSMDGHLIIQHQRLLSGPHKWPRPHIQLRPFWNLLPASLPSANK